MNRRAFTLIELLVIIAIVGILAGILIVSMSGATNNAYDARRKADIANLYSSIVARGSTSAYPDLSADINESSPTVLKDFINTYLKSIPTDPRGPHQYFYYGDGADFAVGAVLEDGTCFVKQTKPTLFDTTACTKLKQGGIGLVENFMVLGGGSSYNLKWTLPSDFVLSDPTTATALICLGKNKTDTNPPTDSELLTSGTLVAIISGGTEYRYYASNADYNYYCKAITYDNTKITNPGTPGSSPNTGNGGFSPNTPNSGSGNSGGSSPSSPSGSPSPSSNPPSPGGSNNPGGSTSPNFVLTPMKNVDGTGTITLSWTPGNLSTHTIIRRAESTSSDPSIAPKTLSDGTEIYNKLNTLNGNDSTINPNVVHTYTDTGLNQSKYYCYSAWAYDSNTNTYSNGYVLACSGIPPEPTTNLTITPQTSSLALSWTKGTGDKTIVRRQVNTAPTTINEGELVYGDTASSYTDDGSSTGITLVKNTNYCYTLWSYNSTLGTISSDASSSCSQISGLGNATNLTFPNSAYNSIVLNWTVAAGSTKSVVVRKQGSIPTSRTDGTEVYNDTSNSFMDSGLSDSTRYCYAVWGYDGSGYSSVAATGCETTKTTASCLELKASGITTSGIYTIDTDGEGSNAPFQVYCDMTTDGGGWTLVAAQYENDPITNWNEGIQSDYDPSLATKKSFVLNTSQMPVHNQVAFGQDLNPTAIDYVSPFVYGTGNIDKTIATSPKTGKSYHIHRNNALYYTANDPEGTTNTDSALLNTLTFDETGGAKYSWAFSPNAAQVSRGYAMNGDKQSTSESYAWTVWVRNAGPFGSSDKPGMSCFDVKNSGVITSGIYWIDPTGGDHSDEYQVYCDMTNSGGGWTLVMQIADNTSLFEYNSSYWSTTNSTYNTAGISDITVSQNMKTPAFNNLSFNKMRIDARSIGNSAVINKVATNCVSAFTTYQTYTYDFGTWLTLWNISPSGWNETQQCQIAFSYGGDASSGARFGLGFDDAGCRNGTPGTFVGIGVKGHNEEPAGAGAGTCCNGIYYRAAWVWVK